MKARRTRAVNGTTTFCEACTRAGAVVEVGGRLVSRVHPAGCPTTKSESRAGDGPGVAALRTLVESDGAVISAAVRLLDRGEAASPEAAMILAHAATRGTPPLVESRPPRRLDDQPMSEHQVRQVEQRLRDRLGGSPDLAGRFRPLSEAASAPHKNAHALAEAREADKRGHSSAMRTLLERLERVEAPASVEAARDLARRRLGGVR